MVNKTTFNLLKKVRKQIQLHKSNDNVDVCIDINSNMGYKIYYLHENVKGTIIHGPTLEKINNKIKEYLEQFK